VGMNLLEQMKFKMMKMETETIIDVEAITKITSNILCWGINALDINKSNENIQRIRRKMLILALMFSVRVPFLFNDVSFRM
jgi:hypothetical protein